MEVAVWQMIAGSILLLIAVSVFGTWFTYRVTRQKRRNDSVAGQSQAPTQRRLSKGSE